MNRELPSARDFLLSGGFGGAATLLAAIVVAIVAAFALRQASKRHRLHLEQQERHHRELRDIDRHAAAVKECRERLAWVVDKGSREPTASEYATLGFGPELALTVLQGLLRDAQQLDDATLATAAAVELKEFSLVLAKQGSALSAFTEEYSPAADTESEQAVSEPAPHTPEAPARETPLVPAQKVAIRAQRG
ncbi:hypothetical protein [Mycobacterium arosiense]|uniref:Uncharacterized protein n=1 Tax=Mycobacterium arosiense ATCC BAA-1401 = DSM 45069 TaxID=1265311 RepID=A0A1W9Z6B0_MYCAI|nr:hypothetical protein [Mycobacterium arosiense]ORA07957.1 hypothetical protein BST14_25610 [Mycobacterium arosiense ATCC BAA-1401 = DSM 45069]